MSKINLIEIINNVAEELRQDLKNQNKNNEIEIKKKNMTEEGTYRLGIEKRMEE